MQLSLVCLLQAIRIEYKVEFAVRHLRSLKVVPDFGRSSLRPSILGSEKVPNQSQAIEESELRVTTNRVQR